MVELCDEAIYKHFTFRDKTTTMTMSLLLHNNRSTHIILDCCRCTLQVARQFSVFTYIPTILGKTTKTEHLHCNHFLGIYFCTHAYCIRFIHHHYWAISCKHICQKKWQPVIVHFLFYQNERKADCSVSAANFLSKDNPILSSFSE